MVGCKEDKKREDVPVFARRTSDTGIEFTADGEKDVFTLITLAHIREGNNGEYRAIQYSNQESTIDYRKNASRRMKFESVASRDFHPNQAILVLMEIA